MAKDRPRPRPRLKVDYINLRVTPAVKAMAVRCAQREHRTLSSLIETLIIERATKYGDNAKTPSS